jgi:hypothetical protein
MTTVKLTDSPDLRAIILAADPGYRKHNAFIQPFGGPVRLNSYWDGGSINHYTLVDLGTLQGRPVSGTSHPHFDVQLGGHTGTSEGGITIDEHGIMDLHTLPVGHALVMTGLFRGRASVASVYVHADHPLVGECE